MRVLRQAYLSSKGSLPLLIKGYITQTAHHINQNKREIASKAILPTALGLVLYAKYSQMSECLADSREAEEVSSIFASVFGAPAQKTFEECFWEGP